MSTSDGLRMPMRGKSLTGRALSRYFVHEGLTSYTHISDQYSTYGTQIIVSTERDATFTLDEILGNTTELPIIEHTTDSSPRRLSPPRLARLGAYPGVTQLGALQPGGGGVRLAAIRDRGTFVAFCGLIPSEHSSGERTRRGHITHAGNVHLRTQLVESAWTSKSRATVGVELRRRQEGLDPAVLAQAWTAQVRLCGRFRRLDERKTNCNIVVTAIARELAGFVWAEMIAEMYSHPARPEHQLSPGEDPTMRRGTAAAELTPV